MGQLCEKHAIKYLRLNAQPFGDPDRMRLYGLPFQKLWLSYSVLCIQRHIRLLWDVFRLLMTRTLPK